MLHDALFLSLSVIFRTAGKVLFSFLLGNPQISRLERRDNRIILAVQIVPQVFQGV